METDRIKQAMDSFNRAAFLPVEERQNAAHDEAVPIGYDQTMSQPSTLYEMLKWLDVQEGQQVLDVGSGSGWSTAILSKLVGPAGRVFAVERVPELVAFGRDNCEGFDIDNAAFFQAGSAVGLPEYSPYHRILVSASADSLPTELIEQLKPGGKLVVPVGDDIVEVAKTSASEYDATKHHGFVFVPLVRDQAN